ncbi:MAG: hypothetical protein IPI07_18550 [Flavobacteriales bacterium]|nr:hypothetical protein [Flavobacteriales bacterium]
MNKRNEAIGFYEHMGFRILREEVIDIGSGYVMDDYVMGRARGGHQETGGGGPPGRVARPPGGGAPLRAPI